MQHPSLSGNHSSRPALAGAILLFLSVTFVWPALASESTSVQQPLDSTSVQKPFVQAIRTQEVITADGLLTEGIWHTAPAWTRFFQRDPVEGAPATKRTEVRVVYDDAALYVGARMSDNAPDSIVARLSRKDVGPNSDYFALFLDPYRDGRSGFYFGLDVAGTYYDGVLLNDDWDDSSWDGVWEGSVSRDSAGWYAEMRIPFSQLRFQSTADWGVNFARDIARNHETDYLAFTPKNGSGFVSRFGVLTGIDGIHPPGRIEILPYVTTRAEYTLPVPGDPFDDGSTYSAGAGADLKVGIGTNLTLDATINPDFGQVEVDPAVVNLSDVETFYEEKRPFFLEGASIFHFGQGGGRDFWNFNFPSVNIFYSRRLGRAPQGSVPEAEFTDVPLGTKILGAAKLSGKLGDNWSIGSILGITAREYAELQSGGERTRAEIEPLAYYGVFRGHKEFSEGRQGLGFLSTVTERVFQDDRLRDQVNRSGVVLGIDGWTFLDGDKEWVITGAVAGSRVAGNQARMVALQTNSQHYFQRPDGVYSRVDSSATFLSGYAARFWLAKQKGNVFVNSAFGIIHPKFEINDLGYFSRSDVINAHIGVGYQWVEPTSLYRRFTILGAGFRNQDFDGNTTWQGLFVRCESELSDYSQLGLNAAYNPETVNNRRTRGGPLTLNSPGYQLDLEVETDYRRDIVAEVAGSTYQSDWQRSSSINVSLGWRPSSSVSLSIGPGVEIIKEYSQWIGAFADPLATNTFGTRYVFGTMDQTTVSGNVRVNWTFTPKLSLQIFMQPLISSGRYVDIKELAAPRSYDFNHYETNGATMTLQDGEYVVDPDGSGPAAPFSFMNPDFSYVSLRGNAVLRWEFSPGSSVYFVWTQTRSESNADGSFQMDRSVQQLLDAHPDNIFLIKISYWWHV